MRSSLHTSYTAYNLQLLAITSSYFSSIYGCLNITTAVVTVVVTAMIVDIMIIATDASRLIIIIFTCWKHSDNIIGHSVFILLHRFWNLYRLLLLMLIFDIYGLFNLFLFR